LTAIVHFGIITSTTTQQPIKEKFMPLPFTLPELESAMNTQIKVLGGINAAIEVCDRMYSADFRSEVMALSSVECWEELKDELLESLALYIYQQETKVIAPVRPEDGFDCEWEADGFYDALAGHSEKAISYVEHKYPNILIDGNTQVVEICNYKGEGEGIELLFLNKNVPIFKSKSHSFNQVN
jgi:hypothetical protein